MALQLIRAGSEQFVLLPLAEYEQLAKTARLLVSSLSNAEPTPEIDVSPPVPEVGESRLRAWRRHRGMTLEELGNAVGKPKSFLSQIEIGKSFGKPGLWRKLARALQTEIEAIIPEDD
ncbi:MAG: helix-turn-helix transcriptional regulator [Sphingomonadales bacterium]|nr:helix-turn-helix transcriptional regulator [Sphingomonadales bacterium]